VFGGERCEIAVINGQKYALIYIRQVDASGLCPNENRFMGGLRSHGTLASNERKRAQQTEIGDPQRPKSDAMKICPWPKALRPRHRDKIKCSIAMKR